MYISRKLLPRYPGSLPPVAARVTSRYGRDRKGPLSRGETESSERPLSSETRIHLSDNAVGGRFGNDVAQAV